MHMQPTTSGKRIRSQINHLTPDEKKINLHKFARCKYVANITIIIITIIIIIIIIIMMIQTTTTTTKLKSKFRTNLAHATFACFYLHPVFFLTPMEGS